MAWAELTDVRCYYEVLGQGDPLLLIPGLGMSCRGWDPIIPELARQFTLILPDNRGMGLSTAKRRPRSVAELSVDLVELLDHLQLDRAHVIGLSFGGIVAQRLAIDHPSRVDRLVLVSCAERFSPYLRQVAMLLRHGQRPFPSDLVTRVVELLSTSPQYLDSNEQLVEQRLSAKAPAAQRRSVAMQLRCVAHSEVPPDEFRIRRPTMVIAGEDDRLIPACYARKMAERIPGSRFLLIRGGGHNALQQRLDDVLPRIIHFLNETADDVGHTDRLPQFTELSV
jgi:pimeloyl-ACP methyl ester carboxylesterase